MDDDGDVDDDDGDNDGNDNNDDDDDDDNDGGGDGGGILAFAHSREIQARGHNTLSTSRENRLRNKKKTIYEFTLAQLVIFLFLPIHSLRILYKHCRLASVIIIIPGTLVKPKCAGCREGYACTYLFEHHIPLPHDILLRLKRDPWSMIK